MRSSPPRRSSQAYCAGVGRRGRPYLLPGGCRAGSLRGGRRHAAARFRSLRQSKPAQPQGAALGRNLRRTRQFRAARALGGLRQTVHCVRRHHALSTRGRRAASRLGKSISRGMPPPSRVFIRCFAQNKGITDPFSILWRSVALQSHLPEPGSHKLHPAALSEPFAPASPNATGADPAAA
jgi:hypothetical protein